MRRGWWAWTSPVATRLDAEVLGKIAQEGGSSSVSPLEGPLELDEEALAAERFRKLRSGVRIADAESAARAPGEADKTVAELQHRLKGDGRL